MLLRIDIIDTVTNELVLENQLTEARDPSLEYQGSDDVFTPIIASQLKFKMLVPGSEDLHFSELFTGNESRYQVKLYSLVSAVTKPSLLWCGYLLPEQYSEPYTNGGFFVSFVATDKLGLLKNKYLLDEHYERKMPIGFVLSYILSLTGYDLPIYYAPAVVHALDSTLDLLVWNINGEAYIKNKKKEKAYTILQNILNTLRCTIFQYNGSWYMIGINRWNENPLTLDRLTYITGNGYNFTFIQNYTTLQKDETFVKFEAGSVNMTMRPPQKRINANWDREETENLIPAEVIKIDLSAPEFLWDEHGTTGAASALQDSLNVYNNQSELLIQWVGSMRYYNITIVGTTASPLSNYLSIKNLYYHEKQSDTDRLSFNLKIVHIHGMSVDLNDAIDDEAYAQCQYFRIKINGVLIVSNISGDGTVSELFTWDISTTNLKGNKGVTFETEITNIAANTGLIEFEFFKPKTVTGYPNPAVAYIDKLELKHSENNPIAIDYIRDIDYTTELEPDFFHGQNIEQNSLKNITLNKDYGWVGLTINHPEQLTLLNIADFFTYSIASPYGTFYYRVVKFTIPSKVLYYANLNHVLLKKSGSSVYTPIAHNINFFSEFVSYPDWSFVQFDPLPINPSADMTNYYEEGDELYIGTEEWDEVITDPIYLYNKWRRYNQPNESMNLLDAVVRSQHDVTYGPLVTINATAFKLLSLFDVMKMNYAGLKIFRALRVTQKLAEGMTELLLMENTLNNVTDYE